MLTKSTIALAAAILIAGCAEKKEAIVIKPEVAATCTVEGATAPNWACVGEKLDGYYTAEGFSTASKGGHGITKDRAYSEALGKLTLSIGADIKSRMSSFTQTTGLNKYETVDTAFEKAVKQSSTINASEVETIKYWEHPKNGSIYLLVGVKQDNVNRKAKLNALSSYQNDAALFQASHLKEIKDELDKEFPTGQQTNNVSPSTKTEPKDKAAISEQAAPATQG